MDGIETAVLQCPCCGEFVELTIDCSVEEQEYTEDCPVCCRPLVLTVHVGLVPEVSVRRENP